jgi:hypothetical protein
VFELCLLYLGITDTPDGKKKRYRAGCCAGYGGEYGQIPWFVANRLVRLGLVVEIDWE